MSEKEFRRWADYYRAHPFDDFHRFHRPAALVSVSMAGGDVQAKLDWLQPEPIPDGLSDADARTMKAFGLRPSAKG